MNIRTFCRSAITHWVLRVSFTISG